MLVNVTPSSGLIGDLHGSLVLSQTEDDGLLLRPAGGKHVRALEPPWFLVNSVDPWSTAWSFFFHLYLGWLPSKLVVFHWIAELHRWDQPEDTASRWKRAWSQLKAATHGTDYPFSSPLGMLVLSWQPWTPELLEGNISTLIFGENMEKQQIYSKSVFSPNPTMERNLPHAETLCNQAVRPEPQLHYHFLSGVRAAWRMANSEAMLCWSMENAWLYAILSWW